jgi:hypothetical protein
MRSAEAIKQFEQALSQLAYSQSLWDVFQDFLDYSLLMSKWWDPNPANFADLEKKYPDAKQHKLFAEAYVAMADIADNDGTGFKDPFGDYFMEHFSSDRRGQFFTPEELCDMMAMLQKVEHSEQPEKPTFNDPSCGSGRTLLSAAKLINRRGTFHAADIDLTCCKMTVINFMMNSMKGEVAWMDTLRMDHWRSWHIQVVMNEAGIYMPYYYVSGPGETGFVERLKKSLEPEGITELPVPETRDPLLQVPLKSTKKGQILLFD